MPLALVTGGARGIGAAIVARLLTEGWDVVSADRDPSPAGWSAVCDVSDEADVRTMVAGLSRLDALVCNAGVNARKPLAALTLADWSRVIATNLTSTFLLVRAAEPLLRAARGAVVTIASTRAHMSEPDTEAYAASKGGLVALTHALAVSLGPDVRVNCISPGWIATKGAAPTAEEHAFHPAGRVGIAADVADMAAFLLGPRAGFITGSEFVIDGGVTRKMIYPE